MHIPILAIALALFAAACFCGASYFHGKHRAYEETLALFKKIFPNNTATFIVSPTIMKALAHKMGKSDATDQEIVDWLEEDWDRRCEGWLDNACKDGVITMEKRDNG